MRPFHIISTQCAMDASGPVGNGDEIIGYDAQKSTRCIYDKDEIAVVSSCHKCDIQKLPTNYPGHLYNQPSSSTIQPSFRPQLRQQIFRAVSQRKKKE